MHHPELPVVSFLCIVLLLCSLPSHIRAGSIAIISLIAWLAVVNVIRGINAIVWADNVLVRLEVWCDITTKITVGFTYAIPASALCILRHLESVASTRNAYSTTSDKRWRQRFEAVMCFGLPMIGMALHYVVQGHRLDIIEDFGCYPPVYFSVAAILILWVPPFAMSLITFIYAALSLRHFLRHRIEFAAHLQNSQSGITPARYIRLMAMALVEMVWDSGVNAYLIYFNTFTGLRPWTNWDDVHSNFSRVAVFPAILIPPEFTTQLIWQWWIVPISCIFFFIFFGFGEEAMSDYRAAITWFRRFVFRQKVENSRQYGKSHVLPTHILHSVNTHHLSLENSEISGRAGTWDELSLKMPEIKEDLPGFASNKPDFLVGHKRSASLSMSDNIASRSTSPNDHRHSDSQCSSDSSFTACVSPHFPSPTGTSLPVSEIFPSHTSRAPPMRTLSPTLHQDASPSPSRQSSFRRSHAPQSEISVSSVYFRETDSMGFEDPHLIRHSNVPLPSPSSPSSSHIAMERVIT